MSKKVIPILLLIAGMLLLAGCIDPGPVDKDQTVIPQGMNKTLQKFSLEITDTFSQLERDLYETANELSGYSVHDTSSIEKTLTEFYVNNSWCIGVTLIDTDQKTIFTIPYLPTNWTASNQKYNMTEALTPDLFTNTSGVLSGPITSNNYGQIFAYMIPVLQTDGTYAYLAAYYRSGDLIPENLTNPISNISYRPTIVAADGMILYTTPVEQIGKNIMGNPFNHDPSYLEMTSRLLDEESGAATYLSYGRPGIYTPEVIIWDTVTIGDTKIRLALSSVIGDPVDLKTSKNVEIAGMAKDVRSEYYYAKTHAKTEALERFNNPETFADKNYMFFAFDITGTVLAYGNQPEHIGGNWIYVTDSYGFPALKDVIRQAGLGGGYTYFYNPAFGTGTEQYSQMVLLYTLPVDDTWIIGAGTTASGPKPTSIQLLDMITKQVHEVKAYADSYGKEDMFAEISKPNSSFPHAIDNYVIVGDYEGNVYAFGADPTVIGQNALAFTDGFGRSMYRQAIAAAKQGGGVLYDTQIMEDTDEQAVFLVYVEPYDDETLIISSAVIERLEQELW